ncbi:MAG: hypothetical protein OEZ02_06585, partial [Anaerolineae bacterium]|nr:hypothetical protein [Anaerolineae bacterium]
YSHHHEASYLQAGALVEFMVKTWGWSGFSAFYRDIHYPDDLSHAAAIDNALQTHFNTTLEKLDQRFLAALQAQPIEPTHLADVQTTIAFYDAARRYQLLYDPSAHFLSAWLLPIADLLDRQITADVFRHPESPENIALETMLLSAEISLQNGDFSAASQTISAVNGVLDFTANRQPQPFTAHPLAADYFALVNTLLAAGYTPQQIDIKENTARVMAASSGPQLLEIGLSKHNGVWLLD